MSESLIAKYIIHAKLKPTSPFLIGKGSGESMDLDVLLRAGQPYIPASSFAGVLRSHFDIENGTIVEYLWGSEESNFKNTKQSHIVFHDLLPDPSEISRIVIRDGIKIVPETGIVKEGGKYDFQSVEFDGEFNVNIEIIVRNLIQDLIEVEKVVADIHYLLDNNFQIGAFTTTGFGKMKLIDFKFYKYEFPKNADHWFRYLTGNPVEQLLIKSLYDKQKQDYKPSFIKNNSFLEIVFNFNIKNTLLVGGNGTEHNEPDKTYLKSFNNPVLSGKSIKGALRHRALQILNTIGSTGEIFLRNMMGWVDDEQSDTAIKSRLYIEEIQLLNTQSYIHNRNKIDRFTGGAIESALFNSEAIYDKKSSNIHQLILKLKDYSEAEVGLLLLLMKDLWAEDLPIGGEKNIGRGVLTGHRILIKLPENDEEIIIEDDKRGNLTIAPKGKEGLLENFVSQLHKEIENNRH